MKKLALLPTAIGTAVVVMGLSATSAFALRDSRCPQPPTPQPHAITEFVATTSSGAALSATDLRGAALLCTSEIFDSPDGGRTFPGEGTLGQTAEIVAPPQFAITRNVGEDAPVPNGAFVGSAVGRGMTWICLPILGCPAIALGDIPVNAYAVNDPTGTDCALDEYLNSCYRATIRIRNPFYPVGPEYINLGYIDIASVSVVDEEGTPTGNFKIVIHELHNTTRAEPIPAGPTGISLNICEVAGAVGGTECGPSGGEPVLLTTGLASAVSCPGPDFNGRFSMIFTRRDGFQPPDYRHYCIDPPWTDS